MAKIETKHVAYSPILPALVRAEAQRLDEEHPVRSWGPHDHVDFFELLLFEQAGGRHVVQGGAENVEPGQVIALSPGVSHDLGELGTSQGWLLVFGADSVSPDEGLSSATLLWPRDPLLAPFCQEEGVARATLSQTEVVFWQELLSRMAAEQADTRYGSDIALRALLHLVLVEAARVLPGPRDGPGSGTGLLAEVFELIEQQYRSSLSLALVADAVHVSPAHLTTKVRRQTGRTVGEWIIYRRVLEGRRLLIETDRPIAEIAMYLGYQDPVLFRRQFQARHGMTPGRWRTAARAGTKDSPVLSKDRH